MNLCALRTIAIVGGCLSGIGAAVPQKQVSDVLPPAHRQQIVDLALALTRAPAPVSLPENLPQPFSPPGFEKADGEAGKVSTSPGSAETVATPISPPQPLAPEGDREILEALAARLMPSGTLVMGGTPQLVIGKNRFPVGTRFTVSFNSQDYELELVSIDRTTFTLRFRGEEFTRPIKPVR
jgi:hypothetical protein